MKVQEFRSQLNYDGARPNLFRCEMTFPILAGGAQSKFTFMARATQLPGDDVAPVSAFYQGRELKFAGNRSFQEWTVVCYNDEDFTLRSAFENWMSGMNSHAGNLRAPEFERGDGGYQQDAFVTQLGKRGEDLYRYKIVGAFPINVSPIELDWGSQNTIEEFAITFAYQWWENLDSTDTVGNFGALSPILPPIL